MCLASTSISPLRKVRVDRSLRARPHLAFDLDHEFVAQPVRHGEGVGRVGIDHDLHQALAVPQVDEDHAAMVAAAVNPAEQGDGLAQEAFVDQSAVVGAHD